MVKNQVLEYSINTILSLIITILIFIPFYFLFGNTFLIWSAILVVGMPHVIIGALGYLASDLKKVIVPFLAAAIFGLILAVVYYKLIPSTIAPIVFLIYFMWHLLINEQMFESTIVTGYKKWQNSWPAIISWGSIIFVLLAFVIGALYRSKVYLGIEVIFGILFLFMLGVIAYKVFNERENQNNVPYGFLFLFIVVVVPIILLLSWFWQGEIFAPPIVLVLFHFISWYVFYTKKLAKFPKTIEEVGIRKLLFGWRKNVRQFWKYIFVLQAIWVGLLLIYLLTPASNVASYLVAPFWAPFWTIIHVTTSFLPKKPITLPSVANVAIRPQPELSQVE